jgi:hypothetical protein
MADIPIKNDGTPVLIYLTMNDSSGNVLVYPDAVITFTAGAITKATPQGIYYAHPLFSFWATTDPFGNSIKDTRPSCFAIRLFPDEITALNASTPYTLSITQAGVKTTYTGNLVVGGDIIPTYLASNSNEVSVVVTEAAIATQLTAVASPMSALVNGAFTISGVLSTTAGAGIANQAVLLQRSSSGVWSDVSGKTATTTATGTYSISMSEAAAGTFLYRTRYAGGSA